MTYRTSRLSPDAIAAGRDLVPVLQAGAARDHSNTAKVIVTSTSLAPQLRVTGPANAVVDIIVDGAVHGQVTLNGAGFGLYNINTEISAASHNIGASVRTASTAATMAVRGIGQGMRLTVQGFTGGSNWSSTCRTRHYSKTRFRRFKVVMPVSYSTGTPIADALFTGSQTTMHFQVGFEQTYTNATTGIPARTAVTWDSGTNYFTYDNGTWDANYGYKVSNWVNLDTYVEADQYFGLWTTVELPSGTYTNQLPYQQNGSNYINRYLGQRLATSSGIAAKGGASDYALTSSSITALAATQTGVSAIYTPCMILIETDSSHPFVFAMGDSICYGVGEGQAGSGAFGDSMGNEYGNAGYISRAIYEHLGYDCVNFGRGSDGNKYVMTANNWKYRRQMMALANPTHVINNNVHNDISATITINNWASTTAYSKYDVVFKSPNHYMCITDGTSGASGPSGTADDITDGTAHWSYIQVRPGSSNPDGSSQIFAWMCNVNDQIQAALPGVPIIGSCSTPDASSSDSWAGNPTTNQTVATGWGNATSRYGLINSLVRQMKPRLRITSYMDPAQYFEFGFPSVTGKWRTNGTAQSVTYDGTHLNSAGCAAPASILDGLIT